MFTKSNKQIARDMTIKYTDVDISKLEFTNLEDNERSKGQKIAYPRYNFQNGDDLNIQCPWFHLVSYGIPKVSEYYPEDSKRLFIKVPLDESNSEVKTFCNFLKVIDEKLSSTEFKEKMFGGKASKYEYQSILRLPQEDDDDNDTDSKGKKKIMDPNFHI